MTRGTRPARQPRPSVAGPTSIRVRPATGPTVVPRRRCGAAAGLLLGALLGVAAELLLLPAAWAEDGAEFAAFETRARAERPGPVITRPPPLPWPTELAAPRQPLAAESRVLALAAAGDWKAVLTALRARPTLALAMDAEGHTLLARAAAAGQTEAVRQLIARGADLDRRAPDGLSPVQLAVAGGHADVVRALLKAGADTWRHGGAEEPPLHAAARLGDVAVLRALLEGGADPLHTDSQGRTALAVARFSRQPEARALLGPSTEDARQRLVEIEARPVLPIPFRR
jgi:hypothetical protein